MNKKVLILVLIVAFGILASALSFSQSEESITNYPSSGTNIVAFGDSLVQGVGASSEDKNFVALLSDKLGQPIINLGVSGNTTFDGLKRINELDQYKPKVVLLLIGGNDRLQRVPIETTVSNLEKMIEEIHKKGAVVVLLGVRGNLLSDRFDETFEDLRDKYQTAYVSNVLENIFGNNQYMYDAIHPNDAGYQIIADRIYPVLKEVL